MEIRYLRGTLGYAAVTWLPAASRSPVELVDRELRAATRVVTGRPLSTPAHTLIAEADMDTVDTGHTPHNPGHQNTGA